MILKSRNQNRDLWSYHSPAELIEHMKTIGFSLIESKDIGRWTFITGVKN